MHHKSGYYIALIVFVFIACIRPVLLLSQDPVFSQFSEEDGLPSNDIYDVLVARDGHIWFASDNGISRYNGNKFVNYNIEDGLPATTVLKLYEDLTGRIWFLAYNGMLSYFEQGKITAYQYNDSIVKYFADNYFNKIYTDSSGSVLLSPRHGGKAIIDADGNVHTRPVLIPLMTDRCYLAFEDRGEDYFLTIQRLKPDGCMQEGDLYYADSNYYIQVEFTNKEFQRNYLEIGPEKYVVSYRNCVYFIKNYHLITKHTFEEEVLSLYKDHKGKIWISVKYDHGIFMFENSMMQDNPIHYLDGYTVTSVIQDQENDYWLSTEGQGVFFAPGFDFSLYTLPDEDRNLNVMTLAISGNRLWFTTRDKDIYSGKVINGTISNIRKLAIEEPFDLVRHIIVDQDGFLWFSSTPNLRYDPAGFPKPLDTIINSTFLGRGKGDTIFTASKRLAIYSRGKLQDVILTDSERRVYSTYQYDKDIWLGTLYGLYVYRDGHFIYNGKISPILSDRISCINMIDNMLVIGTAAYGLAFIKSDSLLFSISEENGLFSNTIKSVFVPNDSTLWVGTKYGLNKIILDGGELGYLIEGYGQGDGLPSNEINAIGLHDGFIWLATSTGLVSFDPGKLIPHLAPPIIQITSVQINGRDTLLADEYILDYDQNDIRINFSGISYRMEGGLKYRFMMSNINDEIITTKNNWANFPNMPPGEYIFYVNVGNVHGVWNDPPETISIKIRKHYTQTAWFLVLLIFISSAVLLSITMFLQRQRKNKEQARLDLARMEQKMFRLQMNPHFVFNALLAIQGFMYQRNPQDAGRYLTSFAKLIRHTLYGSSEEVVPLDKEIEAMQYYLELQRLRFNDNFEFSIEVGDDIISETVLIPPLLVQPFLENAIEHGLQHKEKDGKLMLSFNLKNDAMQIEIEDNGIGREKAMKIQKKKGKLHKSLGMEIVRKRVDSLNKITGKKISLEIIDLKNNDQSGAGTLIRISIPI